MPYMSQSNDPRRQALTVLAVGGIHVAIGLAVVMGLAVTGVIQVDRRLTGVTITPTPIPPPPTPTETPTEVPLAHSSPRVAPKPAEDLRQTADTDVFIVDPGHVDTWVDQKPADTFVTPPIPSPRPSFTPIAPKPLGASQWISTADYPASPLRQEIEGVTGYRLVIGTNGRVNACEVTSSSGNRQLDEATCRLISKRARFEPGTDSAGSKIVGNFNGTVRWQIPD